MHEAPYNRTLGRLRLVAVYAFVAVVVALARPTPVSVATGSVLVGLGEAVRLWAAGHLVKTRLLITSGPYRYSRNPAYVSLTVILLGLGLLLNNAWLLLVAIPVVAIMNYGVIHREEAYLERTFGDEYLRYKAGVRRWI